MKRFILLALFAAVRLEAGAFDHGVPLIYYYSGKPGNGKNAAESKPSPTSDLFGAKATGEGPNDSEIKSDDPGLGELKTHAQNLGADEFETRDTATARLIELAKAHGGTEQKVRDLVDMLASHPDAEVRRNAEYIRGQIEQQAARQKPKLGGVPAVGGVVPAMPRTEPGAWGNPFNIDDIIMTTP